MSAHVAKDRKAFHWPVPKLYHLPTLSDSELIRSFNAKANRETDEPGHRCLIYQ